MNPEAVEWLEMDYDRVFQVRSTPPELRCWADCGCDACIQLTYYSYRDRHAVSVGSGSGPSCDRRMVEVLDKDMCSATDDTCLCYPLPTQPLRSVPEPTEEQLSRWVTGNWNPDLFHVPHPTHGTMLHFHSELHEAHRERVRAKKLSKAA